MKTAAIIIHTKLSKVHVICSINPNTLLTFQLKCNRLVEGQDLPQVISDDENQK